MKKIAMVAIASLSLCACANNTSTTIDGNNDYRSQEQNSPNVGSRAYSGAEFPAENNLQPPAPGKGVTSGQ